ncbi:hypothetical protein TH19_20645 [Thalassospira profundimaris]|uniref:Uncharacterized protein n=2 Tax=Thalassospira TaxID=168934 RepID=A0A367W1J7_9PROT|nr:hypothetical protein TH19_20645 [Thalassospira profundimaris]
MTLLCGLYGFRIAGQYVQREWPQSWLPPAGMWYSGDLGYSYLLAIQVLILIFMLVTTWRAGAHHITPRSWKRRLCQIAGWGYLVVILAQMIPGISFPPDAAWLAHAFPLFFQMILAIYIITLGIYLTYDAARRKEHYFQGYGAPDS